MAKYIDAEELLHRLPNDLPYKGSVRRVLIQAPSADVQEVRHGRWIVKDITPYCSVCYRPSEYECDGMHSKPLFCPNCGAKMDGKEQKKL